MPYTSSSLRLCLTYASCQKGFPPLNSTGCFLSLWTKVQTRKHKPPQVLQAEKDSILRNSWGSWTVRGLSCIYWLQNLNVFGAIQKRGCYCYNSCLASLSWWQHFNPLVRQHQTQVFLSLLSSSRNVNLSSISGTHISQVYPVLQDIIWTHSLNYKDVC
jgi:hypothetical protein